jgi:hypothetical protein
MSILFIIDYVLFNAFHLMDFSYMDLWDGCGCSFEHNLSYQSWSFLNVPLRSFSKFITERYFVLMAATLENPVSYRLQKIGVRSQLSCFGEGTSLQ